MSFLLCSPLAVPVGRRSAASPRFLSDQHCGGEQLPRPCGRSAARAEASSAAAALDDAEQLPKAAR